MLNPLLLFSAQVVSIISVILLAVGYLKADYKASSARVFTLIAFFVVFYLLDGMTAEHIDLKFRLDFSSAGLLIAFGPNSIAGLFMIYCFLIFQEGEKFPYTLGSIFGLQILLEIFIVVASLSDSAVGFESLLNLLRIGMDSVMLVFVGFAIYWTLKGWHADLVEDRRILRWVIIGVQGALIFAVVFVENFLLTGGSNSSSSGQAIIVFVIAIFTFGMLLVTMRFDFVSLSSVMRRVSEFSDEPEEPEIIGSNVDSFEKVFKDGELYREAGLTISELAKKLKKGNSFLSILKSHIDLKLHL